MTKAAPAKPARLQVLLSRTEMLQLKHLATDKGVPMTKLVAGWIREKLGKLA